MPHPKQLPIELKYKFVSSLSKFSKLWIGMKINTRWQRRKLENCKVSVFFWQDLASCKYAILAQDFYLSHDLYILLKMFRSNEKKIKEIKIIQLVNYIGNKKLLLRQKWRSNLNAGNNIKIKNFLTWPINSTLSCYFAANSFLELLSIQNEC